MSEHIIILSPGPANEAGSFDQIYKETYLGGETRMQAGVAISRLRPTARLIMVGGCNISPVFGSDKVDAMMAYARRENPELGGRLTGQPSLPCTYHNLVAAFTLLHGEGVLERGDSAVTLLTNNYHLPRTTVHAMKAWEEIAPDLPVCFDTLAAETVLGIDINDIEDKYPTEYARRLDLEAQGYNDLQSGTYTDACFAYYGEQLASVLAVHGSELSTPYELQRLYIPQ